MPPTRRTRSTKIRPQQEPINPAELGSFPAPTEWSEQLAADNLQLACMMASRMARATRMPFDDLYLVAAQGLLKGCRLYDPERINPGTGRSYRLSTCVVPYIRGAMAQWLRDRGHSSGVRFPVKWRDKGPTVRRLASAGATVEVVSDATGLPAHEIEAILQAQGATKVLDPDVQDFAALDPDPWDEAETYEELSDALQVADQAHALLKPGDRAMLERQWGSPTRRRLAKLPHGQFMAKARWIIRAHEPIPKASFVAGDQQCLALEIAETDQSRRRGSRKRITDPREILQVAEQLAVAWGKENDGGKTATEGNGLEGANSGDQLSDECGQPPELPPSGAGGGLPGAGSGGRLLGVVEGGSEGASPAQRRGRTQKGLSGAG